MYVLKGPGKTQAQVAGFAHLVHKNARNVKTILGVLRASLVSVWLIAHAIVLKDIMML